jgi:ribosomal protein S18 acetylase RimI-like enzyme
MQLYPTADNLQPRPYRGDDLAKVLRFVGECNLLNDFCGCPHPGDVLHFMSNTLRGRNLAQHLYLWEDEAEEIFALVLLYPARFAGFDLLVHPRRRGGEVERVLIAWSEQAEWGLVQQSGGDQREIGSDVMECDGIRAALLGEAGYKASAEPYMCYTTRSLQTSIPEAPLPDGFTMRAVVGEEDAELLREVHSGSFGSQWQPGEYWNVMRTPGFQVECELVVVTPDGRFAAFLVYWLDPISQSGLFEPVGCHQEFQRRGLSKALMVEGMRRMVAQGMRTAMVRYLARNAAASALYGSAGFTTKYAIADFRKGMRG